MGTSTFSGNWGGNLTLEIFSAWNSQNTAGNYSTLNVQVFLSASSYAMISTAETRPLTMTIDGSSEIVQVNPSINYGQRRALLQKDYRINHNPDGTKPQFNISAKFDINISNYGSATATQAIKLPDIKRASTSSNISGTLGSAVTINITRQMSTFKHNLKYDFKGSTGTIATGVDTSYSWTLPTSFADLLPNDLSGTGTLIVETLSGSTVIGENRYTITATIPDTATYKPTLASVSLSDANTATGSLITGTNFVRIMSRPKVTFGTATGKNGATIKSYNAEVVGKNKFITGNGSNFDMLDFTGSAVIRATVTDSRGLTSAPVDTTINVLDYFLPQTLSLKITRAQSDPNIFQLSPIVEIAPLTVGGVQKNQLKIKVEVAPYDTGVYTVDNGPATNTWSTISKMNGELLNLGGSYDKAKSWLVRVTVSDSLNTAMPIGQTVSSEFALMVKTPTGVSFGKIWERGIIDAQGDVYVSGNISTQANVNVTGNILKSGKEIQHYQMTDNTGKITRLDSVDLNTIINDTKPIAVYATANMPIVGQNYYYLEVFQHAAGNAYVLQRATLRLTNLRVFERVRENGIWGSWIELMTVNSPQMINTGWVSTGVSGVYYKRTGDLVSVKFEVTTTANSGMGIGSVPSSLAPANGIMFRVPAWSLDQSLGRNLQINSDGSMTLLSTSRGDLFRHQVSWTI
ncbi:DUF859 domain-containing protein [Streptococcus uberis]|uniref:DUF859 domain-containing protein n=1 Tax=Streptococcus uberis TaxID=1349 RepID=UPI00215029B1|nr:DUF859 domain-containing protein [Streptococcus uberis]MCR4258230.1 DUF859 domain-containing protein [Streptococcus uberis]